MMRQERKDLLDVHIQQFARQLKVDEIVDRLIHKKVINHDVGERIVDPRRSDTEKRKAVVMAVKTRGDTAYDRFYEALLEAGHSELAALLEPLIGNDATQFLSEFTSSSHQYRTRRAVSPAVFISPPRERRESVTSITSLTSTYQDVVARARSRSRSSRVHISDRSIYTSPVMTFSRQPTSSNSSFNGGSLGYNSGRRGGAASEYIFHEESMNYVDSPHINRIFDERTMYRNFSNPRGLCLIINNEHFGQMPSRNGTKADRDNLMTLFRCMGYQVMCRENLAAREMIGAVRDFAKCDHGDSAILVILSHGEDNVIIGVDDVSVSILELTDCLNATNAPRLANKPKLFFIQACRGERRDTGFPYLDATDGGCVARRRYDEHDSPLLKFLGGCVRPQPQRTVYRKKPNQADMLIAYATTAQYVSWRNSVRGSWFIQAVCEVFSEHAGDMDVFELLTEVNNRVACGFHTSQGPNILKQMPETTSRLLKKFYFWPRRNSAV